jgi:hypothetical protein
MATWKLHPVGTRMGWWCPLQWLGAVDWVLDQGVDGRDRFVLARTAGVW